MESSCPVDIPVEEVAKARRDADIQQVHINSYGGMLVIIVSTVACTYRILANEILKDCPCEYKDK